MRVRLLQTTRVPPSYTVVVPVRVDSDFRGKQMLLEPILGMESKMDDTLVDMSKGTAYVSISNTDTSTLKLNRGVQISTATQVEVVEVNAGCKKTCDKSVDLFRASSMDKRRTERGKKL